MMASSPINSSPTLNQQTGISPLTNPISTAKFLSKQEREALLQYTKHFVRKSVQIIVQSRLGDKKPTKSRVYAYNTDWFNLSIKDIVQITSMTKMSLGNVESLFNVNSPFCVEISLKTPENQTMILETWCIAFNDQLTDASQKICYNVYKKMSLVLRSLMCITRSTPTYQLSRRQSSDTYVLLYRMYTGEPLVHNLGENYATAKVGTVSTAIGSLIVNLAYRTRLTMTPQTSSHLNELTGGIQIKDDHFVVERKHSMAESPCSDYSTPPSHTRHMPVSHTISGALNEFSTVSETMRVRLPSLDEVNSQIKRTQPIPMKPSAIQIQQQQQQQQQQQRVVQRYYPSSELNFANDEQSSDASSSVASTPDTIYYFKLKSAAFVPSASFTNNYFSSSLTNENDLPPFITLLSNDLANLSTSDRNNQEQLAPQSPLPPQHLVEYYNKSRHISGAKAHNISADEHHQLQHQQHHHQAVTSSPCSLPNFKMLDYYSSDRTGGNMTHRQPYQLQQQGTIATAPHQTSPQTHPTDDFVLIDSKKIAFGLSNASDDLRTFFKMCENAPILESFQSEPCFNDLVKDLNQQLLTYESKIAEFDELIKNLDNTN